MNYYTAKTIIQLQERNIRKANGIRFIDGDYEYRLSYFGGFAPGVSIDRRKIGARNFKDFGAVGVYDCWNVRQVVEKAMKEVKNHDKIQRG